MLSYLSAKALRSDIIMCAGKKSKRDCQGNGEGESAQWNLNIRERDLREVKLAKNWITTLSPSPLPLHSWVDF